MNRCTSREMESTEGVMTSTDSTCSQEKGAGEGGGRREGQGRAGEERLVKVVA